MRRRSPPKMPARSAPVSMTGRAIHGPMTSTPAAYAKSAGMMGGAAELNDGDALYGGLSALCAECVDIRKR